MPRYINTTGKTSVAIAVCDRCKMKRSITDLVGDPNSPGLAVCQDKCADKFDPYRLPTRKPEKVSLRRPRPEVSVALSAGDDDGSWYPPVGNP